jgi:hypothetical protein
VSGGEVRPDGVPENARGIAAESRFWSMSDRDQAWFRRGWWDAYDAAEARSAGEAYLEGFRESLVAHGRMPTPKLVGWDGGA